jgi:hypothetical protein
LASCKYSKDAAREGMRCDCFAEDTSSAREVKFGSGLRHSVLRTIVAEDAETKVQDRCFSCAV